MAEKWCCLHDQDNLRLSRRMVTASVDLVIGTRHRYRRGTLLEIQRGDVSVFWYGGWSAREAEESR
jgi:hypothetical protein